MKTQPNKLYYFVIALLTFVFFSLFLSFQTVYSKYEKVILFISSECDECNEIVKISRENNIEDFIELQIYNINEQSGKAKLDEIIQNSCQNNEAVTPLLYIDNECITQTTRMKSVLETLPDEVTKFNKGKHNTKILIIALALILPLLVIIGKQLKGKDQ